MEKTCKVPDPKYVAVDDDIHDGVPDPSTPTKKRKKDDETAPTMDGDASDEEILINLLRLEQLHNSPTHLLRRRHL